MRREPRLRARAFQRAAIRVKQLQAVAWLCLLLCLGTAPAMAGTQNQAPSDLVTSEILKNYMAGMTYIPTPLSLPTDEDLDIPASPSVASTEPVIDQTGPGGTDDDVALPDPVPVKKPPARKPVESKPGKLALTNPVPGAVLSSRFGLRWGRMHEGIDLAVPMGTPIHASESGKITYSGWASGYGNFLIVDHGSGVSTRYGHASKLLVRNGQKVKKGQVIALAGSTGHSTGPHLHFEVVHQGEHFNPLNYLGHYINVASSF